MFKVNQKGCAMSRLAVEYLGHVIFANRVVMGPKKGL